MMKSCERGHSLLELLIALTITASMLAITLPALARVQRLTALRGAASEMRVIFDQARQLAVARNRNIGIKFSAGNPGWNYAIYEDGDGDGVLNKDIASGADRLIRYPRPVLNGSKFGRIGLPVPPVPDPDSGKLMAANASPVRFNQSAICSFSRHGEGTSGSIYLTDGYETAAVLRINGTTGRIRTLTYDRAAKKWK